MAWLPAHGRKPVSPAVPGRTIAHLQSPRSAFLGFLALDVAPWFPGSKYPGDRIPLEGRGANIAPPQTGARFESDLACLGTIRSRGRRPLPEHEHVAHDTEHDPDHFGGTEPQP